MFLLKSDREERILENVLLGTPKTSDQTGQDIFPKIFFDLNTIAVQ